MKKLLTLMIVFLVVGFIFHSYATEKNQNDSPKIEIVGGNTHNFGHTKQGQSLKHEFTIKNTGNDTLRILSVKGG
jgi:hypothetical protein